MALTYITLATNGVEKKLADWGLELDAATLELRNQAPDMLKVNKVNIVSAAENAAPTFAFEQKVVLYFNRTYSGGTYSGGTVAFVGKRVLPPLRVGSSGSKATYQFEGPWYDLEINHYQQAFAGSSGTFTLAETILFTSTAVSAGLAYISVGDQIQAILQWLLDQYALLGLAAPFQYQGRTLNAGHIDLNKTGSNYNYGLSAGNTISPELFQLFILSYISKPMMAADALRKCLELSPRTICWFDYTTTDGMGNPLPTIHFDLVDDLSAMIFPVLDGSSNVSAAITRRDDLIPAAVIITYKITSQVNGKPAVTYQVDKWGPNGANSNADPNGGPRVVTDTVNLVGASVTTVTGHLDCESLVLSGSRAWWSSRRGGEQAAWLDSRVRFPSGLPAATVTYASTGGYDSAGNARVAGAALSAADSALFVNRLVRGTHHAWMLLSDNVTPVQSLKVRVSIAAAVNHYDAVATGDTLNTLPVNESASDAATNGNLLKTSTSEEHHANLELTNGVTGTYQAAASFTPGEIIVLGNGGIAQYLYQHLAVPQYDGTYVKIAAALGTLNLGMKVCFNGTLCPAAWNSLNAQVQSISMDLGKQETSIQVGVAKHLNAGQLSSILNFFRNRQPWYNPLLRADPTAGNSDTVDEAQTAGSANTTVGEQVPAQIAAVGLDTADSGRQNLLSINSATGQLVLTQQPAAGGTAYVSGIIAPQYTAAGSPGPTTLA